MEPVDLYGEKKQAKLWHDYGPTLAAEELAADYGIVISRESLRQWPIEAKSRRARWRSGEQVHVWCPWRAGCGELVQWDTSMIDDATSQLTARFMSHDSGEENLRQLRSYVEQHGRYGGGLHRPG